MIILRVQIFLFIIILYLRATHQNDLSFEKRFKIKKSWDKYT